MRLFVFLFQFSNSTHLLFNLLCEQNDRFQNVPWAEASRQSRQVWADRTPTTIESMAGEAAGEELFRLAARLNTKRVQYQPGGLYTNPYQKDESNASAIKGSFSGSRETHARLLKTRHLEDASRDEQSQEEATKPKAKARRAAKSRATPKCATRVAPPNVASVPS